MEKKQCVLWESLKSWRCIFLQLEEKHRKEIMKKFGNLLHFSGMGVPMVPHKPGYRRRIQDLNLCFRKLWSFHLTQICTLLLGFSYKESTDSIGKRKPLKDTIWNNLNGWHRCRPRWALQAHKPTAACPQHHSPGVCTNQSISQPRSCARLVTLTLWFTSKAIASFRDEHGRNSLHLWPPNECYEKFCLGKPFGRSSISSIWHQMSSNHHAKIYQNIHPSPPDPPGRCSFHRSPHPLNRPTVRFHRTFLQKKRQGKHQICWDFCQGTFTKNLTLTFTGTNQLHLLEHIFWWSWKIFDKLSFYHWMIHWIVVKSSEGWWWLIWLVMIPSEQCFWHFLESRMRCALSKKRVLVDCKKVNKWWSVGVIST